MSGVWDQIVDILRESMIAYAYVFNGNFGAGILAVTFLARLALLPITLRLTRLTSAHQARLRKIQPELDEIKRRFANDSQQMNQEVHGVFAREGISPVPTAGCLGAVAPAPVLIALYSAVRQVAMLGGRFGWIRNISTPDSFLTFVVAAIGAATLVASPSPSPENRHFMMVLSTVMTIIVLSKMSAGVALYWGMSNAFGVAQGLIAQHYRSDR
jgi:YidC/Oxa1 family membrane protein insertase